MRINRRCLVLLFILSTVTLPAQHLTLVKDLSSDWTVFKDDRYETFESGTSGINTVYFRIDASSLSQGKLNIKSSRKFEMFVNGQAADESKNGWYKIDSLASVFGSSNLLIAVHQANIQKDGVLTRIYQPSKTSPEESLKKRSTDAFNDFAIVGFLLLVVIIIVVSSLNPKLAADYFSINKIFSAREVDDSQVYSRIASSTNMLFYAYCSLMLGYYMMIIFHFVSFEYPVGLVFQAQSFGGFILQWLELSLYVLLAFFIKIVIVFVISFLFGLKEIAGIQFFNWMRLLLVFFGAVTIVLFSYFIMHGRSENFLAGLLKLLAWTSVGWMVLIFLKLSGKRSVSMFHLFSYICATELIPFLLTVKVLYN
jgi:hypothetical protein